MPPSAASITIKSPNGDETFSTPPSTPSAFASSSVGTPMTTPSSSQATTRPSTSRRPSTLQLPHDRNAGWVNDVELVHDQSGADQNNTTPRHTPDLR
ncbi:hypothetical protein FRC07_006081, partial [Ceratobasidium sp. 392]